MCLLNPGGYQCSCPTGIQLKPDKKSCNYGEKDLLPSRFIKNYQDRNFFGSCIVYLPIPNGVLYLNIKIPPILTLILYCFHSLPDVFHKITSNKFIIFAEADAGEIYKVPLETPETPCYPLAINTNISRPVAVDYDPLEGKVYWTDVTLKLVASSFPNGSAVEVIADNNLYIPGGLAVNYVGRNIYWTDEGTNRIEVAKLDGSSRRGLITSSVEKPRAILLDVAER